MALGKWSNTLNERVLHDDASCSSFESAATVCSKEALLLLTLSSSPFLSSSSASFPPALSSPLLPHSPLLTTLPSTYSFGLETLSVRFLHRVSSLPLSVITESSDSLSFSLCQSLCLCLFISFSLSLLTKAECWNQPNGSRIIASLYPLSRIINSSFESLYLF